MNSMTLKTIAITSLFSLSSCGTYRPSQENIFIKLNSEYKIESFVSEISKLRKFNISSANYGGSNNYLLSNDDIIIIIISIPDNVCFNKIEREEKFTEKLLRVDVINNSSKSVNIGGIKNDIIKVSREAGARYIGSNMKCS